VKVVRLVGCENFIGERSLADNDVINYNVLLCTII